MLTLLVLLIRSYMLVIVVRVLLSWMPLDPRNPLVTFIDSITEPILAPVRRLLPTGRMTVDLSPLFVLLALGFLARLLVSALS